MNNIEIKLAEEDDWFWIIEKHAETAWASLAPDRRSAVTAQDVQTALAEQIANLRALHGKNNQVFVAHESDGQPAGYIWVGEVRSGFTGVTQAHIINIFVAETFRRQGIGRLLIARAEEWARKHQLDHMALNVSASNTAAIELYERLDYRVETLRMSKNLAPRAGGK